MKDIRIFTLYSGSGGNCHYIKCGDVQMLFDAGKNAKQLTSALSLIGADLSCITKVYITHEHRDHTSALRVLKKKHPQLCIVCHPLCAQAIEHDGTDMSGSRQIFSGDTVCDGKVCVRAFRVPHDASACLGYRIEYRAEDALHCIGIATDMGCLTKEAAEGLCGCEYVIIESNHDTEMLRTGPYPDSLKERVFSAGGHLSNEACAKLCTYLAEHGTRYFALAHISKENNTPELALKTVSEGHGEQVHFVLTHQDRPAALYETE